MPSTERLVRAYVRALLTEDDGGGDYTPMGIMTSDAAVGPYGIHFGNEDDLYKIFIKPFVDVVDTTMGKAKEVSQKTQTLVKVAFETIATTVVPILTDSYKEIFAHEQQEIGKIRKEYGEVYQSNWDAFRDNDFLLVAFMYSPASLLTYALAKKSPKAAGAMISSLTGGAADPWLKKVGKHFNVGLFSDAPAKTGLNNTGTGPGIPMEGLLREDGEQADDLAKMLSSNKVKQKIQGSETAQKMEQQGKAMVRNTLEQVFKHARGVLTARNLQELQQKTGTKLKGMDKLAQVPEQERATAEQAIMKATKDSMKSFYLKNLEGQVKSAINAGVPQDHPYISDYQKVISKIKAL